MSGRGRGRGAFGRGRGGPPEIKDEDGQYVPRDVAGPPPIYPEVDLPVRQSPSEEASKLKARWRALTSYWKKSPYHLKLTESKTGVKRSLDDFLDSETHTDSLQAGQLAKVLTLHPKYFPEELFTSQEKRISSKAASSAARKQYWAAMNRTLKEGSGLPFDRLAKMEAQGDEEPETANAGEPAVKAEEGADEGDEEQEAEEDEPGEDEFEDDDYLQGQEYDDDEGYEDDLGDDGDEGGGAYY